MSSILRYFANKAKLCVWCATLPQFAFQSSRECLHFVEDSNCGSSGLHSHKQESLPNTSSMYISRNNMFFFLGTDTFDHLTGLV